MHYNCVWLKKYKKIILIKITIKQNKIPIKDILTYRMKIKIQTKSSIMLKKQIGHLIRIKGTSKLHTPNIINCTTQKKKLNRSNLDR